MNSIRDLQNAVEYIEKNIDSQFDLDALAKECYLSPFYFHRLFSKAAKMTVFAYIKNRRLTIAAHKIMECNNTITEIANQVGYVNYEQFSRDFKQKFTISPNEYRQQKTPIVLSPKLDFNLMQTIIGEDETVIFDQMSININVVQSDELNVVGISRLCGLGKGIDDPGMLWGVFHGNNVKDMIPNNLDPWVELGIGITNYSIDGVVHGFHYIAGRQVTSYENIPDDLVTFTVPSGLYAICRVEAETFDHLVNEVMYKAGGYMLNKWLPENGKYAFKGEMTIEKYYKSDVGNDSICSFDYCFPIALK